MPEVTFHALRHTHASLRIDAGVDIVTISNRFGPQSPTLHCASTHTCSATTTERRRRPSTRHSDRPNGSKAVAKDEFRSSGARAKLLKLQARKGGRVV